MMRGFRRTVYLLLAAFLLASTASVAAHYSAHANANAEQCLLCASHAGVHAAAAAPDHGSVSHAASAQILSLAVCLAPLGGYRFSPPSRGPPTTS